jgi:imidazolonepropionase-like amidohydrolase
VSFVLRKARIIDGTGAGASEGLSLVIANGRIAALGPDDEVVAPEGAQAIDLAGHTILPGLMTMHEHISYGIPPTGIEPGDIRAPVAARGAQPGFRSRKAAPRAAPRAAQRNMAGASQCFQVIFDRVAVRAGCFRGFRN